MTNTVVQPYLMFGGRCEEALEFYKKAIGAEVERVMPTEAEADRVFTALAEGGKVGMPLGKTFYSPRFGMLTDKFGVGCMVIVPAPM